MQRPKPVESSEKRGSLQNSEQGLETSWARRYLSGWKFGVKVCAATVGTILIVNVVMTVFAVVKYENRGGLHIIHQGSCARAKKLNLLLHLLINVVGTLLLAASNYCMQGLSSPTREEVDKVHGKSNWLDIGIPGVRNLRSIDRRRVRLWIGIWLTSLPLHLLFNSAVFSAISANEYSVLTVSAEYAALRSWDTDHLALGELEMERIAQIKREYGSYQRLEKTSCIKEYGKQYLSTRRDVILVAKINSTDGNDILGYRYSTPEWDPFIPKDPFNWICDSEKPYCNINSVLRSSEWVVHDDVAVDYCLSQSVPEHCQFYFNSAIMVAVILSNLIKLICMCIAAAKHGESTLVTLGDAIASFLELPDTTTRGMCLATKKDFYKTGQGFAAPRVWRERKYFWFQALSWRSWILFCLIACGSLLTCGLLLMHALSGLKANGAPTDLDSLWEMGLGTINMFSLVFPEGDYAQSPYTVKSLLGAAVLVNIPQLILSLNYFFINSHLTSMLAAYEWRRFATEWKGLRVTRPIGAQKSTYFLQLPYRYAIPLLTMSALLHWLVSQAFFLAKIVALKDGQENVENSTTMFGFSPIAMLFALVAGSVVFFGVLGLALRRYKSCMPLASSCSAAISAACHPRPSEGRGIATRQLRWGVLSLNQDGSEHCGFGSSDVQPLITGRLYA